MRYATEHREKTRAKIVREAASAIRAKGPDGIGVAALMKRAGLTHGGFYAHFTSKDDLIAEAISAMFDDARGRFDGMNSGDDPAVQLEAYVDFYLSQRHRDARERGCPLASLSSDVARLEPVSRERFGKGVAALTARLERALGRHGIAEPALAASSMLSELVGALSLARAVADPEQSDAILANAMAAVKMRFRLGARA
ncbi:TetR/AcrR family transcriptional regulator [soil metagenome]